ncbi:(S)-scoulerine 9-O-methyltransferase [Morella rubra]|uniref:(S)-scoulerine 9-O-methyltransferase n=1 Tax=Morella rubra TaxID=262757 RepID=A0A6A1WDH5_9ROSI|nr:(S)-scoulerine 9-O-methyltransferase [Morella rubra]
MEVKLVGDHLPCWGLACLAPLQMAARAAIELNVFSIIADAGPEAHLSAAEITSKIATTNPKSASTNLDRLLRFLGANCLLTMAQRPFKNGEDIHHEWTYGLTKQTCSLATNSEAGISSDSSILPCFSGKEIVESMIC